MKRWMFIIPFIILIRPVAAEIRNHSDGQKERCPVCMMFVDMFRDWNAAIEFRDGTRAVFDGPKDMFKYYHDMEKYRPLKTSKEVSAVLVKDYYLKNSFDATKAYYAVWGDEYGPMGHEPVPFENEADAKKYIQEHKAKKILRFADITPRLLWELDNPE